MVSSTQDSSSEQRWREFLPLGLVLLALLAISLVPIALRRETAVLRDAIENAADPGRTYVTQIQYLLARQTATLRGYLLTSDRSFLENFEQLAADEAEAFAELEPLVRRLGGEPIAAYVELQTLAGQWHERLRSEIGRVRRAGPAADGVPFEQNLYLQALAAANRLDEALLRASRERRAEIRRQEERALLVNGVLVLLALSAALSVAWLSHRVRRLAGVAELRRREAEAALEEIARATELRAKLLRGITHDVKNPLGVADGYADLLELGLKGELTPAQLEVVGRIRRSVHDALGIIHDLLELSQVEGGALRLEPHPTDLNALTADLVEGYRAAAEGAGHRIAAALPTDTVRVETDANRVRQVLGNLVTNAIKYTPPPGQITVHLAPGADGGAAVRVEDTGPGIPPEARERIFAEFQRLPGSAGDGHGLGLAISRRIARLLGGELTLDGEPRRGAAFVLLLPARPPHHAARPADD